MVGLHAHWDGDQGQNPQSPDGRHQSSPLKHEIPTETGAQEVTALSGPVVTL